MALITRVLVEMVSYVVGEVIEAAIFEIDEINSGILTVL